jgi:thiol-disulfide isomerase/thioredoxin
MPRYCLVVLIAFVSVTGLAGLGIGVAAHRNHHFSWAKHEQVSSPSVTPVATARKVSSKQDSNQQSDPPDAILFAAHPSPAPAFTAKALDGRTISTADWHGKVVLLNFWATWCPPCRDEIPELIDLQNRYKDKLQIIGVSVDQDASPEEVKAFAAHAGINYPIMMATTGIMNKYDGVPALPTSFVVNRDGGVVQKHVGEYPTEDYENEIRALWGLHVELPIQTFEDNGQIFLKNTARATSLPGVDLKDLTPAQKTAVLKRLNSESCTCGCDLTIAQCRVNDSTCDISEGLASKIIKEVVSGAPAPPAAPPPADPSSPMTPISSPRRIQHPPAQAQ